MASLSFVRCFSRLSQVENTFFSKASCLNLFRPLTLQSRNDLYPIADYTVKVETCQLIIDEILVLIAYAQIVHAKLEILILA